MKRTIVAVAVLICSLASVGCAPVGYTRYERGHSLADDSLSVMTTNEIVALSKAGISDSVIITMIDVSGSYFHLGAHDVIALTDSGVSEGVINAMIRTDEMTQNENDSRGYMYYPRYYGYGYYPFWDPWYYPSFSLGFSFRHNHPFYGYRVRSPRFNNFGVRRGFGGSNRVGSGGHGFGGGRGSGGSRSRGGHR